MAGLKALWVAVLLLVVHGKYPSPSSWATWTAHLDIDRVTDRNVCPQITLVWVYVCVCVCVSLSL